jgi:hypothetical protein
MPSQVVTATNVALAGTPPGALVAAEERLSKYKVTSMTINNAGGAADRTIEVWDSFTPDITNGVAVPVFTTARRHNITVPVGDFLVLEEEDLKGVECLGNLSILADAIDAGCLITVGYKAE